MRKYPFILVVVGLVGISCSGEEPKQSASAAKPEVSTQAATSRGGGSGYDLTSAAPQQIEMSQYTTTESGLQYFDFVTGSGAQPQKGQRVSVHYTGWYTSGKKFDSSVDRDDPFEFSLGAGQVIKGWDEGVASMNIGGKRQLRVPGDLAYGPRGHPAGIPPNATLIFEVQLLGIE
jgi:FKBP-type peptidyl-prolyl cis-trans isomerase